MGLFWDADRPGSHFRLFNFQFLVLCILLPNPRGFSMQSLLRDILKGKGQPPALDFWNSSPAIREGWLSWRHWLSSGDLGSMATLNLRQVSTPWVQPSWWAWTKMWVIHSMDTGLESLLRASPIRGFALGPGKGYLVPLVPLR